MKILYKPFALVAGFIAARVGKSVFHRLWSAIDEADPPSPRAPEASFGKVVGAAALKAATLAGAAAAADRVGARVFHHLIGVWPGKKGEKLD